MMTATQGGGAPARPPEFGEAGPDFAVRSNVNAKFVFNTVGGRYLALAFLSASRPEASEQAIAALRGAREVFNETDAAGFVVAPEGPLTADAGDLINFFDDDGAIAAMWGIDHAQGGWRVLDPSMRLIAKMPLEASEEVVRLVRASPPPSHHAGVEGWAPVLLVPRIFEPELCRELIKVYRDRGGEKSGFMREVGGKTVLLHDPSHKRRADVDLDDPRLMAATRSRILNRLVPEIFKAYQFKVTRMERYLVARYGDEEQGFFRPHRDNTTPGTAHRRFAVTLNLNAEDYEGGELRFPEFGMRTYKPPTGGAVVFSCSLLHEATPVTRGERFAFLPFLYDEAAAQVREANAHTVVHAPNYKAGSQPAAPPAAAPAPAPKPAIVPRAGRPPLPRSKRRR